MSVADPLALLEALRARFDSIACLSGEGPDTIELHEDMAAARRALWRAICDEALAGLKELAAVRAALPVPAWRREPPTVEEVKAQRWWWACTPGETPPYVLQLDLDTIDGPETICDAETGERLSAEEWGTHWLPCVPGAALPVPVPQADVGEAARALAITGRVVDIVFTHSAQHVVIAVERDAPPCKLGQKARVVITPAAPEAKP